MATQFPEASNTSEIEHSESYIPHRNIPPPMPTIPDYDAFQHLIMAGRNGTLREDLNLPRGVSVDDTTGYIYVVDCSNQRIKIFSEKGKYINEFGKDQLCEPWGILIHGNHAYVTDFFKHTLVLYSLPRLKYVKQVGGKGSGKEEFNSPRQPAVSPNKLIYVPDSWNNRLQVLDCELSFQGSLQHTSMTCPDDVKFSNNEIVVLSNKDNPCVHIFTLSGEKIRSVVTRGDGMQVFAACNLCLDACNNILISDYFANTIKVFSPEGELLHTLGEIETCLFNLDSPRGIAILRQTKLVCISRCGTFALNILSP